MTKTRLAAARVLVALLLCTAVVAHAASDGVPPVAGTWVGKLSSVYWDQTSAGSIRPRLRYKTRVSVSIVQNQDAVTMTITFPQGDFPLTASSMLSQMTLNGFAGNYHLNAAMDSAPAITLSGTTNRRGTALTLTGVAASTELTHELRISLKKTH